MAGKRVLGWAAGLLAASGLFLGHASADWPQFLGPDRTGVAADAGGIARAWPDGGPKVLWQVPLGGGFAGPCVFGDSVLILDRQVGAKDIVRRLRLSDGKEIWRHAYDAPGKVQYPGSRSTPATDGRGVYVVGTLGHFKALRFDTGAVVWEKHLLRDWGGKLPTWAVSQSPLLLGDMVIVAPWGRQAAVVAYQKETGKDVWRTPNRAGKVLEYQSVVPMTVDGTQTIVSSARNGYTIGVDAATGAELWAFSGFFSKWQIPSPTVVDGNRVLLTAGYRAGSVMLRIEKADGRFQAKVEWQHKDLGSHTAQALFHEGHIYGNSTDTGGGLRCLTPDGQVKWDSKSSRVTFERGFLMIVDGMIFDINGKNGELFMVEADPGGFKVLGRAKVLGGVQVWAPMAYSDGKLLVRDQSKLVCLQVGQE